MGPAPEGFASLPAAMSRRSLRPQLNQIRSWVRQGRTDAWIAHQLEVTVQQIQAFKREHDLEADGDPAAEGVAEEVDLRAEDDAAIAEQLEAEAVQRAEEEARAAEEAARKAAEEEAAEAEAEAARAAAASDGGEEADGGRGPSAPAPQPLRAHAQARPRRPAARGHLRPRRGGLRPVARPRRRGRPRLRRALGRPPPGRGHDRGGPDRDPPRRRRRGRRRPAELDRIVAHLCAVEDAVAERTEPLPWGTAVFHARMPIVRETNMVRVEAHAPGPERRRGRPTAVEARFADRDYRNVEVLDEATGAALAPGLEAAGFRDQPPPADGARRATRRPRRRRSRRSSPTRCCRCGRSRSAPSRTATSELVAALLTWERERARVTRARAFCARGDGRPPGLHVPAHGHAARHRGGERLHDARPAPPRPRLRRRGPRRRRGRRTAARSCSRPPAAPRSTSTAGWASAAAASCTASSARRRSAAGRARGALRRRGRAGPRREHGRRACR